MQLDLQQPREWIEARCVPVSQPIGAFYVAVFSSADIVGISYADRRRIEHEQRDVERYLGFERPLLPKRVAELKQYVKTLDATFPSSVILAIDSMDEEESRNVTYDEVTYTLRIRNRPNVARILDGQHRIEGLVDYEGPPFQMIATVFVDIDIESQAMIFATINLEQTKVNRSLVYDLYDYAKKRSPQKTAHNIVRALDTKDGSPLRGRFKMLGSAMEPSETFSQALFVDSLLPLVSRDPLSDRDILKRGKTPRRAIGAEERELVFRNMFIEERDADIAQVLWNYFVAVDVKWGEYWRERRQGIVLNRTTGFKALMQFLPYAYLAVARPGQVPSAEGFKELFGKIDLDGAKITPENYPPGSSGQKRLRDQLLAQAGLS